MKLKSIDTIWSSDRPNVCIVRLNTDEGIVGLGETFYNASAVESYIHNDAARHLLNLADVSPESASSALQSYVGYQGSGVEMRGNSALNIAIFDALAHQAGMPLNQLLGGPTVDSVPIYNTCAGMGYVNKVSRQTSSNWGLPKNPNSDAFEDLWAFMNEPAALAKELVAAGFSGMKVWPFDLAAEEARGSAHADLSKGLWVLDEIRSAVGDKIELYVEMHNLWDLPGAKRLLNAIEPYSVKWAEDPIQYSNINGLKSLAADTSVPIATGETLAGASSYLPLLKDGIIDFAIVDLGWTGGVSEGLRIASLANLHSVPIAPHDCTGPISLAVGVHLATSVPNCHVQEVARAFYYGWYGDFVTGLPEIKDGRIYPSKSPGLGVELTEEFLKNSSTKITTTKK
jgi:galactonate dehydratase